jgi:glycosyltransferase involved in cell wall biosynthesis
MARPLVSVIVPTYNCERFIGEAIGSVLAQSYGSLEVVAVDDGSADGTVRLLREFGDRVRVFTQANRGPAAARNHAVQQARGEYLAFLDGDDLWLPGQPAVLMDHVERHPQTRVIYGDWAVWHPQPDGSFAAPPRFDLTDEAAVDAAGSGWLYSRLLFDSIIHIIAAVIHRSVYDTVHGFDETLRTGSDYDFWLKVSRSFPVVKLDRPVAVYRQNHASVTYTVRRENNAYRLLKRAIDTYGLVDSAGHRVAPGAAAKRLAELAFVHGYRHYWHGDAEIAQQSFVQSLRHRPLQPKTMAYALAAAAKRLAGAKPAAGGPT